MRDCPRWCAVGRALTGMCRAHHVAMVPESQLTIALLGSRLPTSAASELRLHRLGFHRRPLVHLLLPILHSGLGVRQKLPVRLYARAWEAALVSDRLVSPTSPTSTGYRIPMRVGSKSIWTPRASPGLWKKLDVWKRTPHDEERVAFLHGLLRWRRSQQPDGAGGVRTVIRHRSLAQQRLDDRGAQRFRKHFQFGRRM